MKELPENFTDEQHAAWVRYHNKKEKRNEIIAGIIVYGGIGVWLLYSYLTASEHRQEIMGLLLIAGAAYYDVCKRIDKLQESINERR